MQFERSSVLSATRGNSQSSGTRQLACTTSQRSVAPSTESRRGCEFSARMKRSGRAGGRSLARNAALGCPHRDLCPTAKAQSTQNRGNVVGNRARFQDQALRDFLVAHAATDELRHFALTWRQVELQLVGCALERF